MTAQTIILIFTLIIYLIIIFVFNKARIKYAGGKVGTVINLILVTVCLLFIADYVIIFDNIISTDILDIIKSLFRIKKKKVLFQCRIQWKKRIR